MSLSSEEKRALRDKQKLLFSSGQFPLSGGAAARKRALRKRRSPLKTVAIAVVSFLVVVIALVLLVTKAARADEGAPPTKPIDVEIEVRGERPAPSVVFVDGGNALLRQRMRELSLEAGRQNASLAETKPPPGPPASARVLRASVEDGLLARALLDKALARLARDVGACWTGLETVGTLRLAATVGAGGRVASTTVLKDGTNRRAAWTCAQQALAAARWPAPERDDAGVATARLVIDLRLAPARPGSR